MNDQTYTRRQIAAELAALPWPGLVGVPAPLVDMLAPSPCSQRNARGVPQARIAYELLVALARTGWSLRWELLGAVNRHGMAARSGTFTRAYARLHSAGLWEQRTVKVGRWRIALVRLTATGRDKLRAVGEKPVCSEWEQIELAHREAEAGEQMAHTAALCLFHYQARQRGWQVLPAPAADGRAEPDTMVARRVHRIAVEVQGRGGEPWKRAAKWRNAAAAQGFLALCATTAKLAATLTAEARHAGVQRGLATDMQNLRGGGPLWRCCWHTRDSTVIALAEGEALPVWTRCQASRRREKD